MAGLDGDLRLKHRAACGIGHATRENPHLGLSW